MNEEESHIERWHLMNDVYEAMSPHTTNRNLTKGHLFICKRPAIETAYAEFREHHHAYYNEPWGLDFDAVAEEEEEEAIWVWLECNPSQY